VMGGRRGEPFESWARLGLGWNALMAGDVDRARPYFTNIADSGSNTRGMARLLVALIDASDGKDVGVEVFDRIAADETATPSLRDVAGLSGGYARYWKGDYKDAVSVLEGADAPTSSGQLVDDLQYAAAWARVRGRATPLRHTGWRTPRVLLVASGLLLRVTPAVSAVRLVALPGDRGASLEEGRAPSKPRGGALRLPGAS